MNTTTNPMNLVDLLNDLRRNARTEEAAAELMFGEDEEVWHMGRAEVFAKVAVQIENILAQEA